MGVTGSQDNKGKKPVVLIVGGGYAGIQCAKILDKSDEFFVVLIDRKSYFLHNVATLRATVEPEFAKTIMVPYDRLLTHGCVVQAEVTSISPNSVSVHGRQDPIQFDYLIIATGSSYAFPGKIAEPHMEKAIEMYKNLREKIDRPENILVIGGGPVGVELASEIATDFPQKSVTLVHNQSTLLIPGVFNAKLYPRLHEQMEKLNVKMILDDRIPLADGQTHQTQNYIEGKKTFITERTQQSITADLTFICIGAHLNNKSLINGPLKSKINPQSGRLIVNNYFQVDGFENIFAIGDIAEKEDKFAFLAGEHAKYVAKLIPLIHEKKSYPKEYQVHTNRAIFLSVGRNSGIGQLPTKRGMIIGGFPVKHLKSKNLFASRYRSEMNYKSDNSIENKSAYLDRVESMQSMLSISEDDAQELLKGLPTHELLPGENFV